MPFVDEAAKLSARNTALRQDSGLDRPVFTFALDTLREPVVNKEAPPALALPTYVRSQFSGSSPFRKVLTTFGKWQTGHLSLHIDTQPHLIAGIRPMYRETLTLSRSAERALIRAYLQVLRSTFPRHTLSRR